MPEAGPGRAGAHKSWADKATPHSTYIHTQARVHKSPAEIEILRYTNKMASRAHIAMMEARGARAGPRGRGVRVGPRFGLRGPGAPRGGVSYAAPSLTSLPPTHTHNHNLTI